MSFGQRIWEGQSSSLPSWLQFRVSAYDTSSNTDAWHHMCHGFEGHLKKHKLFAVVPAELHHSTDCLPTGLFLYQSKGKSTQNATPSALYGYLDRELCFHIMNEHFFFSFTSVSLKVFGSCLSDNFGMSISNSSSFS